MNLDDYAMLAGWTSPRASDVGRNRSPEAIARAKEKGGSKALEDDAQLAGWGTPTARDGKDAGEAFEADPTIVPVQGRLPRQAALAAWATPTANLGRNETSGRQPGSRHHTGQTLHDQVFGMTSTSSTAGTGSRGALSPALSRWLQGFPASWDRCSPHWNEWELLQDLLDAPFATPEALWRSLAAIALVDCAVTATPSSPRSRRRSSGRSSKRGKAK